MEFAEKKWTVTVGSTGKTENKTVSTEASSEAELEQETKKKSKCGNNIENVGENCENCPKDAGCPQDYECINARCIKEESSKTRNLMLIGIVSLSFIVVVVIILFIYKKKKEKELLPAEKEAPKIEQKPESFPGVSKVAEPIKTPKLPSSKMAILRNYIDESIKRGKKIPRIKQNLLRAGWTEDQIEEGLRTYQNEPKGLSGNKEYLK